MTKDHLVHVVISVQPEKPPSRNYYMKPANLSGIGEFARISGQLKRGRGVLRMVQSQRSTTKRPAQRERAEAAVHLAKCLEKQGPLSLDLARLCPYGLF